MLLVVPLILRRSSRTSTQGSSHFSSNPWPAARVALVSQLALMHRLPQHRKHRKHRKHPISSLRTSLQDTWESKTLTSRHQGALSPLHHRPQKRMLPPMSDKPFSKEDGNNLVLLSPMYVFKAISHVVMLATTTTSTCRCQCLRASPTC